MTKAEMSEYIKRLEARIMILESKIDRLERIVAPVQVCQPPQQWTYPQTFVTTEAPKWTSITVGDTR